MGVRVDTERTADGHNPDRIGSGTIAPTTSEQRQVHRAEGEHHSHVEREQAQQAAGALAWRLCDEIDRAQHALERLHGELGGALTICRALFDEACRQQEHDTLERAERILRRLEREG